MSAADDPTLPTEVLRPADKARLELLQLRVEDGVKLEAIFQRVSKWITEIVRVERAGVWLLVQENQTLRCVDLYDASSDTHASGASLQVQDFPKYFDALRRRKTLAAEQATNDPRTIELQEAYLAPLGINSLLDAPILIAGEVVGVVCCEHVGPPREWTTEERDFAGSMADVIGMKIRAAEMADARVALRTQARQLAEDRRLRSLADMAAGIAHDFGNVLGVIASWAAVIKSQPDASPKTIDSANRIAEAVERGADMRHELLDFALPKKRAAQVIRPCEVAAAYLPTLQAAIGAQHVVCLETRSHLGRVLMPVDQLERVLMNLVMNARDATPDSGTISIAIDAVQDRDEDGAAGQFVTIRVKDEGTGIAPAILPRVFDPFYSTKPRGQGTGLGLAIVNQIVSHAGGLIRVETVVGQGSTFIVLLPRISA